MRLLVCDTSNSNCSAGVFEDGKEICYELSFETKTHSETFMPLVHSVMSKAGIRHEDLDGYAVTVGPGSFTGVRSSIAAARAFSLANPQMAITGVSAFEAYIHSLDMSELSRLNAVIIETKREDFYFQLFNGKLEKLEDAAALPYEQIIDKLKGQTVTLIGNGVERFLDKPSGLVLHAIRMDKSANISDIAACALQKYKAKKLNFPKPLYLRPADVCVKS